MHYACWNLRCPKYAGKGIGLWSFEVRVEKDDRFLCKTCGGAVRRSLGFDARFMRLLVGAIGGGAIGGALFAQTGSYVGAVIGVVLMAFTRR